MKPIWTVTLWMLGLVAVYLVLTSGGNFSALIQTIGGNTTRLTKTLQGRGNNNG